MALLAGCSIEVLQANIAELEDGGYSREQAVMIALGHMRQQGCDMEMLEDYDA